MSPLLGRSGGEDELVWLLEGPWGTLAILIVVAVSVLLLGGMLSRGAEARRARGRGMGASFDLEVARMDALPVREIRALTYGPAHVEGTIHSTAGALGGPPQRACVYRNRVGAGAGAAVGSPMILVEDRSGRVAVEELERARVLAPRERDGPHEALALYVGDRVQILGVCRAEVEGEGDPSTRVYGSFGGDAGAVQIKVLDRGVASTSEAAGPQAPSAS